MRKTGIVWVFILFCIATGEAICADISSTQVLSPLASGIINWSKGVVEARGIAAASENIQVSPQGRAIALKEATAVAAYNLFNTLEEIRIDADTKLFDVLANSEEITSRLKAMIKEATVTNRKHSPDGTVEVALQMSLYGGFAQLVLPPEIKQIESIRPIQTDKTVGNATLREESEPNCIPKCFTGVVVDARGIRLKPAMAPRIVDENGDEIFGPSFASREFAVQGGMVRYVSDLAMALKDRRVADNPMTLKGIYTRGFGNCDIIVSVSDANRLRNNFNHLSFLKKCRVIIVTDPVGKK